MLWKVSEHVWDCCCGSTTAQFCFCFVSSTGLGFCFFLFADMLSDLKLYYLVTLQFVSGLIPIVSTDKLCVLFIKKLKRGSKPRHSTIFSGKSIVCFYCSTSKPRLKNSMLHFWGPQGFGQQAITLVEIPVVILETSASRIHCAPGVVPWKKSWSWGNPNFHSEQGVFWVVTFARVEYVLNLYESTKGPEDSFHSKLSNNFELCHWVFSRHIAGK
jgi:hypothetical protein